MPWITTCHSHLIFTLFFQHWYLFLWMIAPIHLFNAVQCSTVQCSTVQYSAVQCMLILICAWVYMYLWTIHIVQYWTWWLNKAISCLVAPATVWITKMQQMACVRCPDDSTMVASISIIWYIMYVMKV
jgi:hypothetical protein